MGKHIRKFQSLTQEDQIMLLKGGVVEVSTLFYFMPDIIIRSFSL